MMVTGDRGSAKGSRTRYAAAAVALLFLASGPAGAAVSPDLAFDSDGVVVHSGAAGGTGSEVAVAGVIDSSGRLVAAG